MNWKDLLKQPNVDIQVVVDEELPPGVMVLVPILPQRVGESQQQRLEREVKASFVLPSKIIEDQL